MTEKKYGWNGWKMPILHPNDPEFCEYGCPICVPASNGKPVAKWVQKIELPSPSAVAGGVERGNASTACGQTRCGPGLDR